MTPKLKTTTDDLFSLLGLSVFEQLPNGLFQVVGSVPAWLPPLTSRTKEGFVDLTDQFPMLEIFLPDCETLWEGRVSGTVQSDIWMDTDPLNREVYLEAVAVAADERRLIAIRSLPRERQTLQQMALDNELLSRKLEKATQAKTDFLNMVSHEIRTPMNAIIGMAEVLSLTPLNAEQKKCVEIFHRNGEALLKLINDLLDLSKVEAGRVELEAVNFDLRDVVASAMEVVQGRVAAKGLWLRQSIAPGAPLYLTGDASRLRQVIINLLGNSIKFTENGGLTVTVENDPDKPAPGCLRFAITDTGIGIPADKLGVIFESFTQADSSTTRKYGGTGLGLNISRQLVALMGGRIWVESKFGEGSTFFFTARFEVQEDQSGQNAAPGSQKTGASNADFEATLAGLHILLVDDGEDNRELIRRYLTRTGVMLDFAENGLIGVERFKAAFWDIVLTDIEMPVMDGYGVVGEIRRIEKETGAPPTPVFALTAHTRSEMIEKGRKAGFTEILTKPIRLSTLLETLAKYAASRGERSPVSPPASEAAPLASIPVISPFRVRIEEGMEDVVPGYLEKRRGDVALYRKSLEAADFDSISKLAHKMKGTGAGYGFPKLTELGAALESAAIHSDAVAIMENLQEFASYVERVELEYPA